MLTTMRWKTSQIFLMVHSPGALDLHPATIWMVHLIQANHVAGYGSLLLLCYNLAFDSNHTLCHVPICINQATLFLVKDENGFDAPFILIYF